jgi:hypothetical protein
METSAEVSVIISTQTQNGGWVSLGMDRRYAITVWEGAKRGMIAD